MAVLTGIGSFRVDMCTEVRNISEIPEASERLSAFASLVDPEVQRLLQPSATAK
jgi:hypothetical protein